MWKVYDNEVKQRCQETELVKPVRNMRIKKIAKDIRFLEFGNSYTRDSIRSLDLHNLFLRGNELQSEKTIELCIDKLKERITIRENDRVVYR